MSSKSDSSKISKPKVTSQHTLIRVRNNQRRHRARVKAHIKDLEQQLQIAQDQLAAAYRQIESLQAELVTYRSQDSPALNPGVSAATFDDNGVRYGTLQWQPQEPPPTGEPIPQLPSPGASASTDPQVPIDADPVATSASRPGGCTSTCCPPDACAPTLALSILADASLSSSPPQTTLTSTPSSSCAVLANASDSTPTVLDCSKFPPPAPDESTTLCRIAYSMLSQHLDRIRDQPDVFIDTATLRSLLRSGFRAETRPREGCRVENGVLMSVLDVVLSS